MKKAITYIVVFILGLLAGMLCREHHFRDTAQKVQRDTVVRYDTVRYTRLDLQAHTAQLSEKIGQLKLPKTDKLQYVYIPDTATTVIYRDSVRYISLPRKFYHTKTDEVEIWHSGIDSTIDSLQVIAKNTETSLYYNCTTRRKHIVSLYGSAGYMDGFRVPVGVEYSYLPARWFSVGGKVEHDFAMKQTGVFATVKVHFGW